MIIVQVRHDTTPRIINDHALQLGFWTTRSGHKWCTALALLSARARLLAVLRYSDVLVTYRGAQHDGRHLDFPRGRRSREATSLNLKVSRVVFDTPDSEVQHLPARIGRGVVRTQFM